jgi:hypothetical protein
VRPDSTLESNPEYTPGCNDDEAPVPRHASLLAIDELAESDSLPKSPRSPAPIDVKPIYENVEAEDDDAV